MSIMMRDSNVLAHVSRYFFPSLVVANGASFWRALWRHRMSHEFAWSSQELYYGIADARSLLPVDDLREAVFEGVVYLHLVATQDPLNLRLRPCWTWCVGNASIFVFL
jgi:hypothetical protein